MQSTKKFFEETREKDSIMQILGPEVGAFMYAPLWPKSGGRIPPSLLWIPMIFWQQFRGSWYNLGYYSYQIPLNAFLRAVETGGRHYSDRLCSDRRYSDNLQSGRPSTSLARLAYVEIVETGKKWEWVEAFDAPKARHWSRHWGDWGEQSLWGYPSGSGVPPPPEKLQRTIVLPLIFGIWFGVFPISTDRRPIQLQSTTRRPDCAWTVGIASVKTESVGIVWCTPLRHQSYWIKRENDSYIYIYSAATIYHT